MKLRRAALAISCLAPIALLPFVPGCGGKVDVVGSGSSSGAGSSSGGVVGSSTGIGSSSGLGSSGSSGGVGSSGSSGTVGSSASSSGGIGSSSGSSGGTSASSSGGPPPLDAGPYSCTNPAPSVPSSEIPPYLGVGQQLGACSASDIAAFINACDSAGATTTACNNWFSTASQRCVSCLDGGMDDAALPNHGGLWYDWQGNIIGANAPACDELVDQNANCASPYNAAVQCLVAAGCGNCTSQAESQMCQQVVFGNGGACENYLQPAENACATDFGADGGALNNGPCSSDAQILSVICGNGSGDGG